MPRWKKSVQKKLIDTFKAATRRRLWLPFWTTNSTHQKCHIAKHSGFSIQKKRSKIEKSKYLETHADWEKIKNAN